MGIPCLGKTRCLYWDIAKHTESIKLPRFAGPCMVRVDQQVLNIWWFAFFWSKATTPMIFYSLFQVIYLHVFVSFSFSFFVVISLIWGTWIGLSSHHDNFCCSRVSANATGIGTHSAKTLRSMSIKHRSVSGRCLIDVDPGGSQLSGWIVCAQQKKVHALGQ